MFAEIHLDWPEIKMNVVESHHFKYVKKFPVKVQMNIPRKNY